MDLSNDVDTIASYSLVHKLITGKIILNLCHNYIYQDEYFELVKPKVQLMF